MSSGLPINTFAEAKEYRNRYLANLALEVQVERLNLNANQVFRQTGQPSRPPDMRTTTEKLADLEGMKVSLRAGLLAVTDGTQSDEAVSQLTPDEITFAYQQLPAIVAELKPRYAAGVPSTILVNYIKALLRKELQTNGVSFPAQESTSQQILNAIQAGQLQLGANAGPIPGGFGNPVNPPPVNAPPVLDIENQDTLLREQAKQRREAQVRAIAEEWLAAGREPFNTLSKEVQEMINRIRAERGQGGAGGAALLLGQFKQDYQFKMAAGNDVGLETIDRWDAYPVQGGFSPYPDTDDIAKEYLKMWARAQIPEVQDAFAKDWSRKRTVKTLKNALFSGWQVKQAIIGKPPSAGPSVEPPIIKREESMQGVADVGGLSQEPVGFGMKINPKSFNSCQSPFRVGQPISRYPIGREILGYGLSKKLYGNTEIVGLPQAETSYFPFGKYKINTNKLASGILDIRTQKGIQLAKYKQQQLSPQLAKTMKRIMGGRLPDEYDFKEMPLGDQHLLYNLAKDAHVMDRLNLPTPERNKDGEEEHRFEILKGQIMAGNDNKELVKEFKSMLLKMSNSGRINKTDAREILMDLVAMGY